MWGWARRPALREPRGLGAVAQRSSQRPPLCEFAQMVRELKPDGLRPCRPAPPSTKGGLPDTREAMEDSACKA